MIINNNITALNAERNYKVNVENKSKAAKKLSSGYRINTAADDAAGITISEKLRTQIRGLHKGTRNAEDGVSWVQVGDGSLNEVHDILHRMEELTIQSLNDTNTPEDRAALQAEFDELQSEIDRICDTTQFNTKNIFQNHEPEYHQMEGNIVWGQNAVHQIDNTMNTLKISYQKDDTSPMQEITISVPEGTYTTQELIDEIDDAMTASGAAEDGIVLEYTQNGTCNLNYEGGEKIRSVSGGLSYLLNDMYTGGSVGALIGTTVFYSDDSKLTISAGNNDQMSFQIHGFDGSDRTQSITIPEGRYTRQELIDYLNANLTGTGVEAVKYSSGIKLQSNDSIITGFKGNMFKIDTDAGHIYTSVFYDNVMYGKTSMTAAEFQGGAVIPTDSRDEKYNVFRIDSTNQTLTLSANQGADVTLTIPEGDYTAARMAEQLNQMFQDHSIGVTASSYITGGFEGLKLISTEKGLDSNIMMDTASGAYATLFTNRQYTEFKNNAVTDRETRSDKIPVMTGGKKFGADNLPLTVATGGNDGFSLKLNGTAYQITLGAGTYNTANDLANAINERLNGSQASIGYKDKVEATVGTAGNIILQGKSGSGLTSVEVEPVTGNKGYEDLFVGKKVTYSTTNKSGNGTSSTPASITLDNPISEPVSMDNSNNKLVVNVNGTNQTVTFPTGQVSHQQITDAINDQLKREEKTVQNTFSDINVHGNTGTNVVTASGTGYTNMNAREYSAKGDAKELQGSVGSYEYNYPAEVKLQPALGSSTVINWENNELEINVNQNTKKITIPDGTYTQEQLKNQLQTQLDAAYGKYENGVQVGLEDGKLVFTARLNKSNGEQIDGRDTYIAFGTSGSSFIKELHTSRGPAVATSSGDLSETIVIDSSSNQFQFQCNDGSGTKDVVLNLTTGTYDRSGFVSELNHQLQNQGIKVTASLYGNRLRLTTDQQGSGYRIVYQNTSGGNSAEAIFGELNRKTPATGTANHDIQSSISIDDTTNDFQITVNGTVHNVKLDNGTYDRAGFVTMLNQKLQSEGAGVTAALTGNRITYTTDAKGSGASIRLTYADGGSSMKQIYGETTTVKPGVTAEFTSDGKLKLTGTEKGGSLSVSSNNGGIFQTDKREEQEIPPASEGGYISTKHAYIDGANISEPVTIDQWNNKLTFSHTKDGVSSNIQILLDAGDYTFPQLEAALQSKLDGAAGAGELKAQVTASGVRIECDRTGSKNFMSGFSGGFYYRVLCTSTEKSSLRSTTEKAGGQRVDSAFTIGRRDIKNHPVEIETGINDELTFDLTYGGSTQTISMVLDAGVYQGPALVNQIQDKINEQLLAAGLPKNMIKAGIGGVNTGVVGANDDNALCLKLSDSVALPAEGEYIIDGVRGSSAFSVFYQSDGEMVPSYAKGSKDITQGTGITGENNEISFDADGVNYAITLPEGDYTADELVDEMNRQLSAANAPVVAKKDGSQLKLAYKNYGKHIIDHVSGSARDSIFYQENFGTGEDRNIKIQLSSHAGDSSRGYDTFSAAAGRDYMMIDQPVVNTVSLGINSVVITKPKYANKALDRLHKALDKVSSVRSMYGAVQNRLEYAILGNENTEENTQSAESRLRDADMAKEMVEYSQYSILQQAGQAVIVQANSMTEGVLGLLQ